jgi:hypothetical protein
MTMEALRSSETPLLQELQGVTSQKTAFFKQIAVCKRFEVSLYFANKQQKIYA